MKAFFERLSWENQAKTIASFYFRPELQYDFVAGQYADITVPHTDVDNRGLTRTMTFSSSPTRPLLRLTARMNASPLSSYKRALLNLEPGAEVAIGDSMGDMVLPLDTSMPLVFVAGGVGVTSYTSMLEWLHDSGQNRPIHFLHSVRSTDDVIFTEILERSQFLSQTIYTPPTGRIDVQAVIDHASDGAQIYLSGGQAMVEQLHDDLRANGIEDYRVAHDYFSGYGLAEV